MLILQIMYSKLNTCYGILKGADNKVLIWNAGTEEIFVEIELPDLCICVSFNYDGSKLVTTCKDKMMRIFNARTGEVLSVSIV